MPRHKALCLLAASLRYVWAVSGAGLDGRLRDMVAILGVMSATRTGSSATAHPFGATASERRWRRLAGAAAAYVVLVPLLLMMPLLYIAPPTYILGIPLSWLVEKYGPGRLSRSVIRRHAWAGAAGGFIVGAGIAQTFATWGGWVGGSGTVFLGGWLLNAMFWLVMAVPLGCGAAAFGAWAAIRLPGKLVRPTALIGASGAAVMAAIYWLPLLLSAI
ncbi:hypothetical protein [Cellulomonas aerilata]|uniref:Prepilin type IV endopeptidase peptidase domain-containing protein n=1 Tax=Cellulomonas aerilata TaxID=515326 RepID=A0A512DAM9_9CELL|nr:hypothetical protein [Cellulomonas aerilata]GEO33541.1 hypothetical protein CAE01nite_12660 [Cellulomonas aerilata]